VGRMVEGTLHCLRRPITWNGRKEITAFRVNAECRPYHLGWVLYAAGLAQRMLPRIHGAKSMSKSTIASE